MYITINSIKKTLGKHIELNDINKIDFTVKEHRIYKGINQTIVTRCKLY